MKLFLIGGFLGSGKTTAIQQACKLLQGQLKVGVITNDQGEQLVDTKLFESNNVSTKEVINGCFCCNYKELEASIQSLAVAEQPEIIFAESVGSCTDLIATVVNPLIKFHPELKLTVSVFADALILLDKKDNKKLFDDEVEYIYQKQLEEADVLVISKIDLLEQDKLDELKKYLGTRFPDKKVLYHNSFSPHNIETWLSCLQQFPSAIEREVLELDYETYGNGEAKLAWLDEELEILSNNYKSLQAVYVLMNKIHSVIKRGGYPVGHLKFLVDDGTRKRKISFFSTSERLKEEVLQSNRVKVIINARVQTEPETLKEILAEAITDLKREMDCKVIERKLLAFRPGFPKPTYRIASTVQTI